MTFIVWATNWSIEAATDMTPGAVEGVPVM
jgi:hypothetical protein